MFDPSKEATLARKYEAAAERGFFRRPKELRQHERALKAADDEFLEEQLASITNGDSSDEEFETPRTKVAPPGPRKPVDRAKSVAPEGVKGRVNVPFAVGKRP